MKWFRFILSHSIFISFCAAALCYQTYAVLNLAGNAWVYVMVFFATLCSYNFYWMAGKFHFRKIKAIPVFIRNEISHFILCITSGIAVVYCILFLQSLLPFLIVAAILTLLYSMPLWNRTAAAVARKTGFVKTVLLAFTWAFVTVIIPAHTLWNSRGQTLLIIIFFARFFFVFMLALIFDRRDMAMDTIRSLHSLATDVSMKMLSYIMTLSFLLYIVAGALVRWMTDDNRQLIAHLISGILVWIVFRLSRQRQGYIFYYFVVDGLMLSSSLAAFLAAI